MNRKWYLEAIKPTVASDANQRAVLRHTLDALVRVLHPVAPFITEAIAERLADVPAAPIEGLSLPSSRRGDTLCTAGWPVLEGTLADAASVEKFERVRELVEGIRAVRSQHKVDPKRKVTLHPTGAAAALVEQTGGLVSTLAGLSSVSDGEPEGPSVTFLFESAEHRLSNLADAIDADAAAEQREKDITDLSKKRKTLEGRLSNPGYVDKAPAHLVDQTREELRQVIEDLERLA